MQISEFELLSYACANGIININTIQMQVEMNERKKYLEMHNHKVWQGKDGYYYTRLDDETAKTKRRLVKKAKRNDLEDAIINFYKQSANEPYIESVFYEWIDSKMKYGEIQKQTYERYEIDFKRFFSESKIAKTKFKYITELDLEEFIKISIHEKQLTAKAWGNLRSLLNGIFKYAKKRGYTPISITAFLGDLDISAKSFTKRHKKDEQCVFNELEMKKLVDYLLQKPSIGNLGVLLAAYTGMRVGEVVSLKWEDIGEKYIYVHRTQIRYHDEDGKEIYEVRDTPKTEAGIRNIVIVDGLKPILRQLKLMNPFAEYVFMKKGQIITKHVLDMCLYRACDSVGIPRRGMHVLRKTYATRLLNSNVDEAIVINRMGHTDIATTKGYYYYNDKTMEKMADLIGNVISY